MRPIGGNRPVGEHEPSPLTGPQLLLDRIEKLSYVDYLTDVKMYSYTGQAGRLQDINEVQAEAPDAILVSDSSHAIAEAG